MPDLSYWDLGENVSVRDAFGRILVHLADKRDDWVLLDADVAGGTGAKPLVASHPNRVMQFGIAEQNMMAASSGLADSGLIPVVSTFAAFGTMRAHEQFRTAVCYANRNVKLCCSHLGMDVGPDGATAQAIEDLATMRAIPGVTVISPADANEFMNAFHAILAEAHKEADFIAEAGKQAFEMAQRNSLLELKMLLQHEFANRIRSTIGEVLNDQDLLKQMILEVARSNAIDPNEPVEVLLPSYCDHCFVR